jgi:enoyl-CoA hydratase/carnithine racemase
MGYDDLSVETDDGVCTITINRPQRLNAIKRPMLAGFSRALIIGDAGSAAGRAVLVPAAG